MLDRLGNKFGITPSGGPPNPPAAITPASIPQAHDISNLTGAEHIPNNDKPPTPATPTTFLQLEGAHNAEDLEILHNSKTPQL